VGKASRNNQTVFGICLAASVPLQFEKKTQVLHGSLVVSPDMDGHPSHNLTEMFLYF